MRVVFPRGRLTMKDPTLGLEMCEQCWDGKHKRGGCQTPSCQCGCYQGRNKGLGKPRKPQPEFDSSLNLDAGEPIKL